MQKTDNQATMLKKNAKKNVRLDLCAFVIRYFVSFFFIYFSFPIRKKERFLFFLLGGPGTQFRFPPSLHLLACILSVFNVIFRPSGDLSRLKNAKT